MGPFVTCSRQIPPGLSLAAARPRKIICGFFLRRWVNVDKLDVKEKRGARRNDPAGPLLPICVLGWAEKPRLHTFTQVGKGLIPTFNHSIALHFERKWFVALDT